MGDMRIPAMAANKDVATYFVTKHAWKGKYKRLFSVGTLGITTYHPETLRVTNQWAYSDVFDIGPDDKSKDSRFFIAVKKGPKKKDELRFSTEHVADLLTEALRYRTSFGAASTKNKRFNACKMRWSEKQMTIGLEVSVSSLDQVDLNTGRVIISYDYKDIELLIPISDFAGGLAIAHGGFGRLHMFILAEPEVLMRSIAEAAQTHVSISLRQSREPITFDYFSLHRMGKYSDDEHLISYAEFIVQKHVPSRHGDSPVRRLLCLTETCLVERDPDSYLLITGKPLCDVFALIRDNNEPQILMIEYVRGITRLYLSTERDALIASILDGVRASGNRDVCVKMRPTNRGLRFGPFTVPVTEEVESQHLKFLQQPPPEIMFSEVVDRFNSNISYSGLLHAVTQEGLFSENKEKLIRASLNALIAREGDQSEVSEAQLEAQFHALRRLVASKAGFQSFTALSGMRETLGRKVVASLRRCNDGVTHAALDTINALMQPMHDNADIRQEQLNKASIMANKKFIENLLEIFTVHVLRDTGALVISAMLDFLTFAMCPPYCETSDGSYFDQLIHMVADRGRTIFKLFTHPSMAIVKGAGLVMRSLIEEGDAGVGSRMQSLALAEGALLHHLLSSLFLRSTDSRSLTNKQLSRLLISLWASDNISVNALLKKVFPAGLLNYLDNPDKPPVDKIDHLFIRDNLQMAQDHMSGVNKKNAEKWRLIEKRIDTLLTHWRGRIGMEVKQITPAMVKEDMREKPVVLRKRRQRIKSKANWDYFFYAFYQDHSKPNLIWNNKTRDELRDALEKELHDFTKERDFCSLSIPASPSVSISESTEEEKEEPSKDSTFIVSWNHSEFKVMYPSLRSEIRVGEYYLRLLLDEDTRLRALKVTSPPPSTGDSATNGDTEEAPAENDVGAVAGMVKIKQSYEFFNNLFRRFLQYHKVEMKCMCLQAMTIVYSRCYDEIGPVSDTDLLIEMLDRSTNRLERDRLLYLIESLMKNKENIEQLIDANGIRVLVDLVPLAHLHIGRAHTPQHSNVIMENPDSVREGFKEWYYQTPPKQQHGPYSFKELKSLYEDGTVTAKTRVWCQGMEGWQPVDRVSQLKWMLVADGEAVLNPSDMATLVLNILIAICSAYPSQDQFGTVIRPMPRAKRQLTDPVNLPHVVQLLLTFDSVLVEKVAVLLNLVMQDNPFVSRLYLTGVFFFMLMYTGSNLLAIVLFLKYTHLKQAFRSEENQSSDIMFRSILGHILPEAMVCFLENHPADKFAQYFLGDYDTPEAIWNAEMRRFMIERLAAHLAEFTPRLFSNTRALYQYLPIPVIVYPQLQTELFCDAYYLRHLCDTQRFPNWPIREPVRLLRDILKAWRDEVDKKPPSMSIGEAYTVLGISADAPLQNDESVVRKAYFKMAQKYHPDKNPEGRDKFEEVNKAYEFLCSRSKHSDGPNPKNIVLILKSQSIIFGRYKEVLAPHKYAGYPMLIKTIQLETSDDQLFAKETPLLAAASELAYHTVSCSALNAEEMRRENGIQSLQDAFSRCVGILSTSSKPEELAVRVSGYITVFYSVAAQFPACRERIQELPQIVKDLLRILYFKNLPQLCCLVCKCVSSFCVDFWLQTNMLECGATFLLMPFLFNYDFTLDEADVERSEDSHSQEVSNRLACLSLLACCRLAGSPSESESPTAVQNVSPDNPAVRKCLSAMLTPYIGRRVAEFSGQVSQLKEILKLLNCNSSTPYLIWDNGTRSELLDYLDKQRTKLVKTGECDAGYGANFKFSTYEKELIVGEVFVRIYNEQKTFPLENPKSFTIDLLLFLCEEVKSLKTLEAGNPCAHKAERALEALRNVMVTNPGVEIQCIGHFKLLFSLLSLNTFPIIQERTLEIILGVTISEECLTDIHASGVIVYLVMALQSLPQCHKLILESLTRMAVNTDLLKEIVYRGAIIYLIDIFANSSNQESRLMTVSLLSKMIQDKLVGKRIRAILVQFIPALFIDAMRDNPNSCLNLYETVHENPELVWNDQARETLSQTVADMKNGFYRDQARDTNVKWSVPEDFTVEYSSSASGEMEHVVGGVYLRIYLANPGWGLRAPEDFLNQLLGKWSDIVGATATSPSLNNDLLELVTTAIVTVLHSQMGLIDSMPRKGYVHKVVATMAASDNDAVLKAGLSIVHKMTTSKLCVVAMSSIQTINPIIKTMRKRTDLLAMAGEAFHKMFEFANDELIGQALKTDLIPYLLELLSTGLVNIADKGRTKAHIVNALKAMQKSLTFGEQVGQQLDRNPIWKEYKDQSHDLFLTESHVAGYLTDRSPEVSGYLMSSSGMTHPPHSSAPPPPS